MSAQPPRFIDAIRRAVTCAGVDESFAVSRIIAHGAAAALEEVTALASGDDAMMTDLAATLVSEYRLEPQLAHSAVQWALLSHWLVDTGPPNRVELLVASRHVVLQSLLRSFASRHRDELRRADLGHA